MAKPKRRLALASEMAEKMQAEENKRRKRSFKSISSQPEQLFLQFDPERKDELNWSSYSLQTSRNQVHRSSWKPPLKSEFELCDPKETKKKLKNSYLKGENKENLINTHIQVENKENLAKIGTGISKSIDLKTNSPVGHFKNDNLESYYMGGHVSTNINDLSGSHMTLPLETVEGLDDTTTPYNSSMSSALCRGFEKNIEMSMNSEDDIPEEQNTLLKPISLIIKEVKGFSGNTQTSIKSNENYDCGSRLEKNENKIDVPKDKICNYEVQSDYPCIDLSHQDCINDVKETIPNSLHGCSSDDSVRSQDHIEIKTDTNDDFTTFSDMVMNDKATQPNPRLIVNKLENSDTTTKESNQERCYSEHEDILNSIDMILSEGHSQTSNLGHNKTNSETYNAKKDEDENLILIDSVFDHSEEDDYQKDIEEVEDKENMDRDNVEKNNKIEFMEDKNRNNWSLNKKQQENISKENLASLRNSGIEEEVFSVKENNLLSKDEINVRNEESADFNKITQNNKNSATVNGLLLQKEENGIKERDKIDVEEEYSCLMISHSQLLEIEKNYYETPQNEKILKNKCLTDNKVINNLTYPVDNEVKSMSIATQTFGNTNCSKSQSTQTEISHKISQDDSLSNVNLQWPRNMLQTQAQLRSIIEEIDNLNNMLLSVRRDIWPKRHNNQNEPGSYRRSFM